MFEEKVKGSGYYFMMHEKGQSEHAFKSHLIVNGKGFEVISDGKYYYEYLTQMETILFHSHCDKEENKRKVNKNYDNNGNQIKEIHKSKSLIDGEKSLKLNTDKNSGIALFRKFGHSPVIS